MCLIVTCSGSIWASAQVREGEWTLATFNVRYDNPSDPLKCGLGCFLVCPELS